MKDSKLIVERLKKNGIKYSTSLIKDTDLHFIQNLKSFKCVEFEKPDLVFESKDTIYAIEHFEAAWSHQTKKWSKFRKEYNDKITKGINLEIQKELLNQNQSTKTYNFLNEISYKHLIENIYKNFQTHYDRIDSYKTNIKEKFWEKKRIIFIFFVEYKDILPHILIKNWKQIYTHISINFLNYFKDKKDIFWIMFSSKDSNTYIPINNDYFEIEWFLHNFTHDNIHSFQPNFINFWIRLEK